MKHCRLLWSILFIFTFSVNAQWTKTSGPYGGAVYALAQNGNTLVAGTLSGVFRSTNDGVTWVQGTGMAASSYVVGLSFVNGKYFAATSSGPYISLDNASTWSSVDSSSKTGYTISAFAKDTMLFAGTYSGLYTSSNNGKTWSAKDSIIGSRQVTAFFTAGNVLFAGTSNGLFRSTNNGVVWNNADSIVNTSNVSGFVVKGTKLFVSTWNGVYVSLDTGKSWSSVKGYQVKQIVMSIATDSTNLYAGTGNDGLYISTDDGDTWKKGVVFPAVQVTALVYHKTNLYAGQPTGVARVMNQGSTYALMNSGLTAASINGIALVNNKLVSSTTSNGLFTSTNSGSVWTADTNSLKQVNVVSFFADTTALRIGSTNGIYRSTDAGQTWHTDTVGLGAGSYATSFSKNGLLFCGTLKGVFINTGAMWEARNNGLPKNPYIKDLFSVGGNMFAAVNDTGIFYSSNFGLNWNYAGIGVPAKASYNKFFAINNKVYIGTSGGVYVSTNNGTNWKKISTGLPGGVSAFATFSGNLFAGTIGYGVYVLKGSDTTWSNVNTGMPSANVYTLFVTGTTLYAGTMSGVWKRSLSEMVTAAGENQPLTAGNFELLQNYPNPFNPSTTINFQIPVGGHVTLKVYDILGKEIAALVNEVKQAGSYKVHFDGGKLSSGLYFYTLQSRNFIATKKFILLK